MNLYVLDYNNYYNRTVKQEDTLEAYLTHVIYGPVQGIYGFTPGDGVNTTQILGSNAQMYDGGGDYLLAVDEDSTINSRWFIIDTKRERSGQWTLTLHRDLVVDFYDRVIDSPMFIEKATLPISNSLIYNQEDMSVSQVKTSEVLLKDKSGCPWIVGYYSQDLEGFNGTVKYEAPKNTIPINTTIEDWEYYQYSNLASVQESLYGSVIGGNYQVVVKHYIPYQVGNVTYQSTRFSKVNIPVNYENNAFSSETRVDNFPSLEIRLGTTLDVYLKRFNQITQPSTVQAWKSQIGSYLTYEGDDAFNQFNNKLVYTSDGKVFRVTFEERDVTREVALDKESALASTIYSACRISDAEGIMLLGIPDDNSMRLVAVNRLFTIQLEEQPSYELTYNFDPAIVQQTLDAPYHTFAIPYGRFTVRDWTIESEAGPYTDTEMTETLAMSIASSIIANHTSGTESSQLYDIQLLPYCPVPNLSIGNGYVDIYNESDAVKVQTETEIKGYIFNVPYTQFTDTIISTISQGSTNIQKKLNNQCDKYRISAPNYSNYFDFNVEKNEGVDSFIISCAYKPYTPYIQIKPSFKGLYGSAFNDVRGLVCGGDFSLSQVNDQWKTYQINNKNFQNTFDRQIQNMEVTQQVQRDQQIFNAATGTLMGGAGGVMAGSKGGKGGLPGMIAGGIIGTAASAVGGALDVHYGDILRSEALDYTKDMFGYQLGNIQALPQTISKVSAFNPNNRIIPVLEYYTCTDVEKKAFVNKLAWNGMTVMAIGTVGEYMGNNWSYTTSDGETIESKGYIKGKLIRLEGSEEDYHIINSLSGELNKGVYI